MDFRIGINPKVHDSSFDVGGDDRVGRCEGTHCDATKSEPSVVRSDAQAGESVVHIRCEVLVVGDAQTLNLIGAGKYSKPTGQPPI